MAKGDFIFPGIDTDSYTSDDLNVADHGAGYAVTGLTLTQLYVTVKLKREESREECICRAEIIDYSLQANAFVGNNVLHGLPQKLVIAHELFHVREKKDRWEVYRTELNYLLWNRT